jgi:cobalt-zinc-cadmium efflux system protein
MGAGHRHHDDAHGHHGHHHGASDHARGLIATLALISIYMVAEVVGGLMSGSLALLADAGHMLSDASALAVSLLALRISRRPASLTHTFGYRRAEILAAVANGAVLIAIAGYVMVEAVRRIGSPPEVDGPLMLVVAAGGLVVNLIALWILHAGRVENINIHGAWLHVLSDTLGSVGAISAGLMITLWGWRWADPAVSLVIGLLVVSSAWMLLKETVRVLMQAVPDRIDLRSLEESLTSIGGVLAVHDLHVWSVTRGRDVMSAHLTIDRDADRLRIADEVQRRLGEEFDLHHSTIQLDCPGGCRRLDEFDGRGERAEKRPPSV